MKKLMVFALQLILIEGIAQNVGIGLTTPDRAKLEINGVAGAGNTVAIFGGDGHGISLQRNWATIGFNQYRDAATGFGKYINTGFASTQSLDPNSGIWALDMLPYGTSNTIVPSIARALAINSVGNIGLGNATPNAPLQFNNNLTNRKIVLYDANNNGNQYYGFGINNSTLRYQVDVPEAAHRFYAGAGASSSNLLMTIQGNKKVFISNNGGGGYLGINLDAATHTLSVKQAGGTGIYLEEAGSGTNWEFRATYFGPTDARSLILRQGGADIGFFRSTGDYVSYSDHRLKTNIEEMPGTLEKILKLKPSIYEFKADNIHHEKSLGFIAQDVKKLFPELVSTTHQKADNGMSNLLGINYAGFGVIAIKAIQEQQVKMNDMQQEIYLLKEQIKKLIPLLENKK